MFEPVAVANLPRPEPFRADCMREGRRGDACCDYHQVDWGRASETAIELLSAHEWTEPEDAVARLGALGLSEDEQMAAFSLLCDAIDVTLPGPGGPGEYHNGQHRAQAMIDQGVLRTVIVVYPDD